MDLRFELRGKVIIKSEFREVFKDFWLCRGFSEPFDFNDEVLNQWLDSSFGSGYSWAMSGFNGWHESEWCEQLNRWLPGEAKDGFASRYYLETGFFVFQMTIKTEDAFDQFKDIVIPHITETVQCLEIRAVGGQTSFCFHSEKGFGLTCVGGFHYGPTSVESLGGQTTSLIQLKEYLNGETEKQYRVGRFI